MAGMDAEWFGVDREGQIAIFNSGEAGAVPRQAYMHIFGFEDGDSSWADIFAALAKSGRRGVLHDRAGRLTPTEAAHHDFGPLGFSSSGKALVFARSLDLLEKEIAAGDAQLISSTEGAAVVFKAMTRTITDDLHARGACLSCFDHVPLGLLSEGESILFSERYTAEQIMPGEGSGRAATCGLYVYDHQWERDIPLTQMRLSGPYGRIAVPARPLRIDELPEEIQEYLGRMRFDQLCFSETPQLQPTEHSDDCESWAAWGAALDSDGRTIRVIPGLETNYQRFCEEVKKRPKLWSAFQVS